MTQGRRLRTDLNDDVEYRCRTLWTYSRVLTEKGEYCVDVGGIPCQHEQYLPYAPFHGPNEVGFIVEGD